MELEEAALMDGANAWQIYWTMFPLARPGVVTIGIFTFMNIWNDFFSPLIYLQGPCQVSSGAWVAAAFGQCHLWLRPSEIVCRDDRFHHPHPGDLLPAERPDINEGLTVGAIKG